MLIHIDVAPHSDNRLLKVSAISCDFAWQGEQPLDGVDSPRTVVFELRDLPFGEYYVKGEIIGKGGLSRGMVTGRFTVMPRLPPASV